VRRAPLALALALAAAAPLAAQQGGARTPAQEITVSQRRLQEIRQERAQLRNELRQIRSQVHDASTEMRNIQRQVTTSASLLRELQFQMEQKQREMEETTRELLETQDRLAERRALLNRRLRDMYKRGPLQTVQVLLAAESFSDLLNRYKYLYMVTRRDRVLVREVDELRAQLALRERELKRSLQDIQYLQTEREQEHQALQGLESERRETISTLRLHERSTTQRVEELTRDERELTSLLATLERRRREAERAEADRRARERAAAARTTSPSAPAAAPTRRAPTPANASGTSTLSTADVGNLAWPVGGRIVYRFGRAPQANGTTIRWNGIGIGAAAGTPVRAVEAGTVVMAGPFEGYGPTVVVSHGGGYYSLYLHLRDLSVREGTEVTRGQQVGTVGGETTAHGPHIEFQIRAPGGQAVDPLAWLRRQSGG
jgi:septal ring factor EnvC (AmiA/AmiB activator)